MNRRRLAPHSPKTGVTLAIALACLAGLLASAGAAPPPEEWDGLVRVQHKQLDHVYVLPGADFSGYKRIRLDPVDVSFDKNWAPNDTRRGAQRLSQDDLERIKETVAAEFRKVFSEELSKGGYTLVEEDGDDVLRVTPMIMNLYVTAPDKPTAGRSRTYVASAGHMTLVAVLRDSVSGQHLARAVDNVEGRSTGRFELSSSMSNLAAARQAFSKWATVLRKGLDDADGHAVPK
jgi:hypothetical protein